MATGASRAATRAAGPPPAWSALHEAARRFLRGAHELRAAAAAAAQEELATESEEAAAAPALLSREQHDGRETAAAKQRLAKPRPAEPRPAEPRPAEPRPAEPRPAAFLPVVSALRREEPEGPDGDGLAPDAPELGGAVAGAAPRRPHPRHVYMVVSAVAAFQRTLDRAHRRRVFSFLGRAAVVMLVTLVMVTQLLQPLVERSAQAMADALGLGALAALTLRVVLGLVPALAALAAAVAAWLVLFVVRRWPLPPCGPPPPEFGLPHEVSLDELVGPGGAQSGDLIIFSFPVLFDGFFSGHALDIVETLLLKLQAKVHWTHVGVVLRGQDGTAYLLESTTDDAAAGHVGPGLCPLRRRIELSADYDHIAWRRCHAVAPTVSASAAATAAASAATDGACATTTLDELARLGGPAGERRWRARQDRVLDWIVDLYAQRQIGRYGLSATRAAGKTLYDLGFKTFGRSLLDSGFDFEFDCCDLAAHALARLGLLSSARLARTYSMPHFTVERRQSQYRLDLVDGLEFSWPVPLKRAGARGWARRSASGGAGGDRGGAGDDRGGDRGGGDRCELSVKLD
jgi:hypothetical protein